MDQKIISESKLLAVGLVRAGQDFAKSVNRVETSIREIERGIGEAIEIWKKAPTVPPLLDYLRKQLLGAKAQAYVLRGLRHSTIQNLKLIRQQLCDPGIDWKSLQAELAAQNEATNALLNNIRELQLRCDGLTFTLESVLMQASSYPKNALKIH